MLSGLSQKERVFSVTELSQVLNLALESAVPSATFKAEISQVTKASSGHVYFTVKDEKSQLACVMWASAARALTFEIKPGLEVLCYGKPNLYHASGRLQMVVTRLLPAGLGALQQKFLELKRVLEAEGFFAAHRKRPLPFLPKAVGLVTSKQGAVIHDMQVKFTERMPQMPLYLVDVRVQGEGAAQEIAQAIDWLDAQKIVDVIIVGRGGGSLEDLWAFNELAVVKAIFRCSVPVISAVGHETDVSLSDLVADVRAPTPTAAAEMVVPKRSDLLLRISELEARVTRIDFLLQSKTQGLDEAEIRLNVAGKRLTQSAQLQLSQLEKRLQQQSPQQRLARLENILQMYTNRLQSIHLQQLQKRKNLLDSFSLRLEKNTPDKRLAVLQELIVAASRRITQATLKNLTEAQQRVEYFSKHLAAISPLAVLERGYAVVTTQGKILKSAESVTARQQIQVQLAQGKFTATVE